MTRNKQRPSEFRTWAATAIWLYAGGGGIGMPALIWWGQDHWFLGVPPQPGEPGWQRRCLISVAIGAICCILGFWIWWAAWRNLRKHTYVIEGL